MSKLNHIHAKPLVKLDGFLHVVAGDHHMIQRFDRQMALPAGSQCSKLFCCDTMHLSVEDGVKTGLPRRRWCVERENQLSAEQLDS